MGDDTRAGGKNLSEAEIKMAQTESIAIADATELARRAFVACGMPAADAALAVGPLIEGELLGLSTHGLNRVPIYAERMRLGGIDPRATVRIDRRAPALALIDGGNAAGTLVATRALDIGLEMVAAEGIGYVGCRASNHCGALMPYGLEACDAGYLLLAGTGASPSMAPWGGSEARLGNNPLCIAAPIGDGPHFVLDMAMSVAARGKIRAARDAGDSIPAGWAVDRHGRPTTDPVAALAGFLAPVGAHKGSGLGQAVDILAGVLSGARFLDGVPSWMDHPELPSALGHFFVLLDPARLLGESAYVEAMARFRERILTTPPADPAQAVRLPGQTEQARRAASVAAGLDLPSALLSRIRALAA